MARGWPMLALYGGLCDQLMVVARSGWQQGSQARDGVGSRMSPLRIFPRRFIFYSASCDMCCIVR